MINVYANSPGNDNNLLPYGSPNLPDKIELWAFCASIWNLSHFLPKFEFPLIQSSVSGAFSYVFDYFRIAIIKANCDGSVAHVRLQDLLMKERVSRFLISRVWHLWIMYCNNSANTLIAVVHLTINIFRQLPAFTCYFQCTTNHTLHK